jgi:hypothetical protein
MVAFRHMITDPPGADSPQESRGALYVAYGDKAREQARAGIASLRAQMSGLPVAVVSDTPFRGADHSIVHVEVDRGARAQKTRMYSLSPFRRTLFLDADTEVLTSPEPGFRLLDYGDVVLSQDPTRIFSQDRWPAHDPAEVAATRAELPTDELLYWNSGVLFFRRSDRAQAFFQAWHREWLRFQRHDQMALIRALALHPVRVVAVRECWNTHRRPLAQFVWHNHRAARREGAPA